jgi:hypothetical protein
MRGALTFAEYRSRDDGPTFDTRVRSGSRSPDALTMLNTRPGPLLLDEPDAHLHIILQDAIIGSCERRRRGLVQLVAPPEVIIDSWMRASFVCLNQPRCWPTMPSVRR